MTSGSDSEESSKKFEIFVGGLPSDTTREALLKYFRSFGDIASCDPRFWTKGSKKNKCRGYGIIICENEATFNNILSKNPHKFEDRRIECKKRLKKQKLAKYSKDLLKRKIFVSCLPSYINSARLQDFFEEKVGPIEIAYIIKHRKSKKSRGFGFVVFKSKEDREKVIQQREFILNHRTICCNPYEPKAQAQKKVLLEEKNNQSEVGTHNSNMNNKGNNESKLKNLPENRNFRNSTAYKQRQDSVNYDNQINMVRGPIPTEMSQKYQGPGWNGHQIPAKSFSENEKVNIGQDPMNYTFNPGKVYHSSGYSSEAQNYPA